MSPDAELVLVLGGLHVVGFAVAAFLLIMLFRSGTAGAWTPPDEDEGGGGNDRAPRTGPKGPRGGLPLPDAQPARARFREPGRLRERLPAPARRAPREPERRPVPR